MLKALQLTPWSRIASFRRSLASQRISCVRTELILTLILDSNFLPEALEKDPKNQG